MLVRGPLMEHKRVRHDHFVVFAVLHGLFAYAPRRRGQEEGFYSGTFFGETSPNFGTPPPRFDIDLSKTFLGVVHPPTKKVLARSISKRIVTACVLTFDH